MEIFLNREIRKDKVIYVGGNLKEIKLPATQLLLLDTNILFPAIFPPKERNENKLAYYCEHVIPGYKASNKLRKRAIDVLWNKRRIKVVDSIENGILQKKGISPAITNKVYGELKNLEKICNQSYLNIWKEKLRNEIVSVNIYVKYFRRTHPAFSSTFDESGDFSLAITSYELGCHFASDDYRSFDRSAMKLIEKMYFERWGPHRLKRHDSESLCMILRS